MKKINILVTGVGAIIGYGIIKSIKKTDLPVNIIGMDVFSDAVGQYWCNKFIQAKYAADKSYIIFLKQIIDEYRIDLVFFGTEQEIYKVNLCKSELDGYLEKLVINKAQLLELSEDKWKTYNFLRDHQMEDYTIPSVITGDYEEISQRFGKEFLLKPRSSYASKGIVKISDAVEFDFYKSQMRENFMAQPIVGDIEHEYTVGVFGLGDGSCHSMIMMKRKLSQEGATAKAMVVFDESLQTTVTSLVKEFKPLGPTNLQFRLHKNNFLLLEINPRISSSTSIRTAFGYNEAELCINYFVLHKLLPVEVKTGNAIRFIDEVVTII